MSLIEVRAALETALNGVGNQMPTQWENTPYTPVPGISFRRAFLLPAEPDNPEIGPGFILRGIFQVDLNYPLDKGSYAAVNMAETVREAFPFGSSLTNGGVTVNIIATPEVMPGRIEDDRYVVPVRIRWHARIA